MGDDTKKKETKIEKKDEFGNVTEEKKIEEKEKEDQREPDLNLFLLYALGHVRELIASTIATAGAQSANDTQSGGTNFMASSINTTNAISSREEAKNMSVIEGTTKMRCFTKK